MKMKNKILGILIALVVMIGVMACQVNAADISASATEIEKGETVVVTVNLDEDSQAVQFDLGYNSENFEFVIGSENTSLDSKSINYSEDGKISFAAFSTSTTTKSVSFTFKALENTEGADFAVSGLVTENEEAINNGTVSVAVVEPAVEPEPTPDPEPETPAEEPETPAEEPTVNEEPTTDGDQKVDEDGNVITRLPQTGTSIVTVAGIVAVVAIVGAIAVRKLRK